MDAHREKLSELQDIDTKKYFYTYTFNVSMIRLDP